MITFAVDFETYFFKRDGIDVSSLGNWHYVRHPEVNGGYLCTIAGDNGFEWVGHPKDAPWATLNSGRIICHNLSFDGEIIEYWREQGVITSDIVFPEMFCSADLSVYCGYARNLKDACAALFGYKMNKSIRDKMSGKKFEELEEDAQKAFTEYAIADARYTLKLWQTLEIQWPAWERRVSTESRKAGKRGCPIDLDMVNENIVKCQAIINEELPQIPWAYEEKVLSLPALAKYCISINIPPPETTNEKEEAYLEWERQYGDSTDVIQHVRRYRKANSLLNRFVTMRDRTRPDGTMALELKYFGADQTGRFSGTDGFNPQNLLRDPFEGMDPRKPIMAGEGYVFILADLAQIEPRVLAWLCGNDRLLNAVRSGYGIYEASAKASGMWDGEKGTMKKSVPKLYHAAKGQALGCGYQMGGARFYTQARVLTGGQYEPTEQEAVDAVERFRFSNPEIVDFWGKLQKAYKDSAPGNFTIRVPSGRKINYWSISRTDFSSEKSKGIARTRVKSYGGKLCENATQATARDVFCDMALRAIDVGLEYVFTVHDELIFRVKKEDAEVAAKTVAEIMSTPPSWIPGLPVECEWKICDRYEK